MQYKIKFYWLRRASVRDRARVLPYLQDLIDLEVRTIHGRQYVIYGASIFASHYPMLLKHAQVLMCKQVG